MEFWGVEVKPGETVKCEAGEDKYLHLSQASLGETKKASESVPVFVKVDDQKLVLGTLAGDKFPQISFDLVFEKEFELSHSSKSASVYFCGYKTLADGGEIEDYSDSDLEDEAIQLAQRANGKPEIKAAKPISGKAEGSSVKPNVVKADEVKSEKPKLEEDDDESDDDDDDDDDSEEDESDSDEDMLEAGNDDKDEDDSSDEEDDATPKKAVVGKKRGADSAIKTPAPEKKAKLVTPAGGQKTGGDGKKGVHTATPHPAKQAGKTPKQQTPKSGGGSVTCSSCSKSFNSENALQAHSKAKHETAAK